MYFTLVILEWNAATSIFSQRTLQSSEIGRDGRRLPARKQWFWVPFSAEVAEITPAERHSQMER